MTVRTITECDRCKREIAKPSTLSISVGGASLDLCKSCGDTVQRVLNGAEVEVPP